LIYKIEAIEVIGKIIEKLGILFLPIYWLSFLVPRNKKIWVCGSTFGKSFSGNPKYFYMYANQVKDDIRVIWISRDDKIIKELDEKGYEGYNINSIKGLFYCIRAGVYVFDHYSKDISFWLSGGAIKVNLWHGIPLKKIHRDNKFDRVRNPKSIKDKVKWIFRRIQNEKSSHYYAVTSEYIKDLHIRAFAALKENVFVFGYARNDIFFSNSKINNNLIINNLNFYENIDKFQKEGKKIIIYMPTHRASDNQFFEIIDLNKLNDFLEEENSILIVKAHHMSELTKQFEEISYLNILSIKTSEDPYPYLNISDILITDYSSVYFDYLLRDKPIIFFPYDIDTYNRETMEFYHRYEDITPGHKVTNMKEMMDGIKDCIKNKDKYKQEREKVRNMMFDYIDGNSCERLYKKIIEITKGE